MSQINSFKSSNDIETLTGDAGGAVSSDALDNINLVGGTGVTTTGTPLTNTITIDITGGIDQVETLYVGKHGNDANSGENINEAKLTIQAALDVATADYAILVYPGTYYEDTINFTANYQTVTGVSQGRVRVEAVTSAISDFSTFTSCVLSNIFMYITGATSAVRCINGASGSLTLNDCLVSLDNASQAGISQPSCIYISGTSLLIVNNSTILYANTVSDGDGATAIKSAIVFSDSIALLLDKVISAVTTSGLSASTSFLVGTGTNAELRITDLILNITDADTTKVMGIAFYNIVSMDISDSSITAICGATNSAIAIGITDNTTVSSSHNDYSVTDAGGTSNSFSIGATSTMVSNFDSIIAADGLANLGTFTQVNSEATGSLTVTNAITAETFYTSVEAAAIAIEATTVEVGGTDANIDLKVTSKGTGKVVINDLNISDLTTGTLRSGATGDISSLADGAGGTLLIGKAGDVPIWANITSTSGSIGITNGANTISLESLGLNQSNVLYVGKHGNDTNDGLTIDKAFLTFGAALTAGSAGDVIRCLDAGTYTENLTGVANIDIYAPNATIVGVHTLNVLNTWEFSRAIVATSTTGFTFNEVGSAAYLRISRITVEGIGIGVVVINGRFFVDIERVLIDDGYFIGILTADVVESKFTEIIFSGAGAAFSFSAGSMTHIRGNAVENDGIAGNGLLFFSTGAGSPTIDGIIDSVNLEKFSNLTATTDARLIVGTLLGTLTEIGVSTVTVCGTERIDNIPIGATTPSTGAFTTLTATTGLTVTTGDATISSGLLALPTTSATVGQITINTVTYFHAFGTNNTFIGNGSGNYTLTTATNNVALGGSSLSSLTDGDYNSALGFGALNSCTSGSRNSCNGFNGLTLLTTGNYNTTVGSNVLFRLLTGSNNVGIGTDNGSGTGWSGQAYTSSESSNIVIQNSGVVGESNKIRIGTDGSGTGQQNATYIAGIYGVTPGGTKNIALIDSNHQLGSVATLAVASGGTGLATITDHSLMVGSGASDITPLAIGGTGVILQGSAAADPVWSTATYPGTAAIGTILVASAANVITTLAPSTDGYLLTDGGAGVAPTWKAPAPGGITWNEATGTTQAMVVENGYICNNAAQVVCTLPTTAAVGKTVRVSGSSSSGWKIAQNASQLIHFGTDTTTTGTTGYLESTEQYDAAELICITTNTTWNIVSAVGNITIV